MENDTHTRDHSLTSRHSRICLDEDATEDLHSFREHVVLDDNSINAYIVYLQVISMRTYQAQQPTRRGNPQL